MFRPLLLGCLVAIALISCDSNDPDPRLLPDLVELIDFEEGDSIHLFFDGFLEQTDGGTPVIDAFELANRRFTPLSGNYRATSSVQIFGFQQGRAPLLTYASGLTNEVDTIRIEKGPPEISIPVLFYVWVEPFDEVRSTYRALVREANQLFHERWAGIRLDPVRFVSVYTGNNLTFFCDQIDSLEAVVGTSQSEMIGYVVDQIAIGSSTFGGYGCYLEFSKNVFAMDWRVNTRPQLLAHEVGHQLGLWHPDLLGLSESNLMTGMGVSDNSNGLTAGQIFRMHYGSGSILQFLGLADPQSPIACMDFSPDPLLECPSLLLVNRPD